MKSSYFIRYAEMQDFGEICDLMKSQGLLIGKKDEIRQVYAAILQSRTAGIVIASEQSGRLAGLMSYACKPRVRHGGISLEIDELLMSPAAGAELGCALLERAKVIAEEVRAKEISVAARDNFRKAFLAENGFVASESTLFKFELKKTGRRGVFGLGLTG